MAIVPDHATEVVDVQAVDDLLRVLEPMLAPRARTLTLSIYVEAGRTPEQAREARIRFKTEVLNRQRELAGHKRYDEHGPLLFAPALQLCENNEFWNHQLGGLAYFSSAGRSLALKCERRFPTQSRLGGDYHLLPLLEAGALARRFYVLGLAEGTVFLHRVSDLGEEELPKLPASFAEALASVGFTEERLEEKEFSNENARAHEHSLQALRIIDEAVGNAIPDRESPLLLAAVEFTANHFAEVTAYPNLASATLSGDPDRMRSSGELGEQARTAMREHFRTRERKDAASALAALGQDPGHALTDLSEVVAAAGTGNLAALTLARGLQAKGSLESGVAASNSADLPPHLRTDLIDFAARRCLADGGTLTFVTEGDLPPETPLVARTRWEPVSMGQS